MARAPAGELIWVSAPSTSTRPAWWGCVPEIPRSSSVAPLPSCPARPTISPRRTVSEAGTARPSATKSDDLQDHVAHRSGPRREHLAEAPAQHAGDEFVTVDVGHLGGRLAATVAEHRDTIGQLEHLAETMRDVDDGATRGDEPAHHLVDPGDVIVGEGPRWARPAGSCRRRGPRPGRSPPSDARRAADSPAMVSGSMSRPTWSRCSPASRTSHLRVITPRASGWPRKTFSATLSVGTMLSSCWTTAMPARSARCVLPSTTSSPSMRMVPRSRRYMPQRILTKVLLPAPFSPTSPITSPRRNSKSAVSSATTSPNDLATSVATRYSMSDRDPGTGCLATGGASARPAARRPCVTSVQFRTVRLLRPTQYEHQSTMLLPQSL